MVLNYHIFSFRGDEMKKILYIVPTLSAGGIESFVCDLSENLKYIFELFRINYNPYVYAITCAVIGCCLYLLIQNNKARVIFLG